MSTLKDKITSDENLAIHVEGQTCTNNLAIQGLTTDLELLKTDQDLHKDRLDDCFRQIETLRIIQQEQEGKLVEFGSTQDRVLAEFQALKEELQREREESGVGTTGAGCVLRRVVKAREWAGNCKCRR